jgi:prepilin-type processing-associated H-X9-DG protein
MERVDVLVCPSDTSESISHVYAPVTAATASYALVQGTLGPEQPAHVVKYQNNGLFLYVTRRKPRQVRDGLSNTTMLGEVVLADTWESSNTWSYALAHADCLRTTANPLNTRPGAGTTVQRQNGAFGSQHPEGAVFCFADGHARFVTDEVEMTIYQAQSTIEGAELGTDGLR